MKTTMSSRERLLTAMALEEPDHVPLWCLWSYHKRPFNRDDEFERVDAVQAMGMDDTLWLHAPWQIAPEVEVSAWSEPVPGETFELMHKRYETPAGTVEQVLRSSEYLNRAEDISVAADLNMSHATKHLVAGRQDLGPLRYLLAAPGKDQLRVFRERAAWYRAAAADKQVLLEGAYVSLGDMAAWLMGPQPLMYAFEDDPEFVKELLSVIWEWHVQQIEILLDEEVDVILHRGWYELPDFWGLAPYRRFLKPLLRQEAQIVHQAGARFSYIMTKGIMPLLEDFVDIGVDVLWGADPIQGEADLPRLAAALQGRICIWGGMNAILTLGKAHPRTPNER